MKTSNKIKPTKHSLFFANISWTIVMIFSWKAPWMRLYAMRVKDLHDTTEVDTLYKIIDIRMPDVVAENEEDLLDALSLSQRDDQVPQVGETCVHLDHYYGGVDGQRTKCLLVVHLLLVIRPLYVASNFRYLELC